MTVNNGIFFFHPCIVPSCSRRGVFFNSLEKSGKKIFGLMCPCHDSFFGIYNLIKYALMSVADARKFNSDLIRRRV